MTNAEGKGRVFVGLDGSLASLRALRRAVAEAKQRGAELHVVHVLPPHHPDHYEPARHAGAPRPAGRPETPAEALISAWLEVGLGVVPADVTVHRTVLQDKPGRALVGLGRRDDDLLVVGNRERGLLRRLFRRSVSRYCAVHARCPVLVVPLDSFAREARHDVGLSASLLRRDLWKQFDATMEYHHKRTQ